MMAPNTDDLRHYTGIGTGYSAEYMLDKAGDEIDQLRALVVDIKAWDVGQLMTIPHALRVRIEAVDRLDAKKHG